MSSKPKRKKKKHKQLRAPKAKEAESWVKVFFRKGPGRVIAITTTVVGLLGVLPFFPQLQVLPRPSTEENDLVATFAILNSGNLPLADLDPHCFVWEAKGAGGVLVRDSLSTMRALHLARLGQGETATVPCGFAIRDDAPTNASFDLGIVVFYRPFPLVSYRAKQIFRFVGRQRGKEIIWDAQPTTEDHRQRLESLLKRFSVK